MLLAQKQVRHSNRQQVWVWVRVWVEKEMHKMLNIFRRRRDLKIQRYRDTKIQRYKIQDTRYRAHIKKRNKP